MDTQSGRIFEVPRGQAAPHGSVPLTRVEAKELSAMPETLEGVNNRARLRRYKQNHADDDCRSCGVKLRRHTLKQFQVCYSE
jgi:hypothetical protein